MLIRSGSPGQPSSLDDNQVGRRSQVSAVHHTTRKNCLGAESFHFRLKIPRLVIRSEYHDLGTVPIFVSTKMGLSRLLFPFAVPAAAKSCVRTASPFVAYFWCPMNATVATNDWWLLLFPWRRARLVDQVGGELARECRTALWRRVRGVVAGMSAAEARGYARAQAGGLAARHVDQAISRRSLSPLLRDGVLASGVDQLARMAVRDALSEPLPREVRTRAA
jgi:hypothetical protein